MHLCLTQTNISSIFYKFNIFVAIHTLKNYKFGIFLSHPLRFNKNFEYCTIFSSFDIFCIILEQQIFWKHPTRTMQPLDIFNEQLKITTKQEIYIFYSYITHTIALSHISAHTEVGFDTFKWSSSGRGVNILTEQSDQYPIQQKGIWIKIYYNFL